MKNIPCHFEPSAARGVTKPVTVTRYNARPHPGPFPQEMEKQLDLGDRGRLDFLKRLDAAEDVTVTAWEADFIGSIVECQAKIEKMKGLGATVAELTFTEPQRDKIDQLRATYEHRLGQSNAQSLKPKVLPEAVPGRCSYFVRGDAGQVRCGQPATKKNSLGAEFCDACWQKIAEWEERRREMKARRA